MLVEIAVNVALQGSVRPSDEVWEKLRTPKHRNAIRQLVGTRVIGEWRRILSSHLETARLLAQCAIEVYQRQQQEKKQQESESTEEEEEEAQIAGTAATGSATVAH